jgi:hypothetical protein
VGHVDQHQVLTAEEYTFDVCGFRPYVSSLALSLIMLLSIQVVPLYQTAMVCLQSLSSSIDILKTLGPMLEAGFTGRKGKPQVIVDAFRDYWDLTCAKFPVPKGRWPSSVITCLEACGRDVIAKLTLHPTETDDVAAAEKT